MATYTFRFPGRNAGKTVTVFDQSNAQVASGATDSNAVLTATLAYGDYYAVAPDGQYVRGGADSPQSAESSALPATTGRSWRRDDLPGIHALPILNPTPPTLTVGTTASALAGSVLVSPDEPGAFTYFGATPQRGTVYPDYTGVKVSGIYAGTSNPPWAVEFVLDTVDATGRFEIAAKSNGKLRVLTRATSGDQWMYATVAESFTHANDGSVYVDMVTMGAPGTYQVRIEFTGTETFMGIRVGPTDAVRATDRRGKRITIIGDSFTEPTFSESGTKFDGGDGWVQLLGYAIGADTRSSGKGGTGYLATNNGTSMKFRDRLATDVIPYAPDEIWWAGGINDNAFTPAGVAAEAALCFAQIAAALPNCKQRVLSPFWRGGVSTIPANLLNIRDALKTEAAKAGLDFIDLLNLPVSSPVSTTSTLAAGAASNSVRISGTAWPQYATTYAYIDAGLATAEVRKVTNWTNNGDGTVTLQVSPNWSSAHAVGATVQQVGGFFISGTGKQGTAVGDGTADRFTGADNTHPTKAGHRNIADHVTRGLRAVLPD